jgi:membrane protein implicated in regulation of membrane protease activity
MNLALTASFNSWTWFGLALALFIIEGLRPGRFALWLGFAAVLVGMISSVAHWPWPAQVVGLVVLAAMMIPAWRRYERKA